MVEHCTHNVGPSTPASTPTLIVSSGVVVLLGSRFSPKHDTYDGSADGLTSGLHSRSSSLRGGIVGSTGTLVHNTPSMRAEQMLVLSRYIVHRACRDDGWDRFLDSSSVCTQSTEEHDQNRREDHDGGVREVLGRTQRIAKRLYMRNGDVREWW